MKTLRSRVTTFIGLLALIAGSVNMPAQAQDRRVEKKPPDQGPGIEAAVPIIVGPDSRIEAEIGPTIKFLEAKFAFDKIVKGAPYSAVAVTETTQTLSDGNQITRKTEVTLYRDSEGRTRREQTMEGVKNWQAPGDRPRVVFINDPIAGYNYVLDPHMRTARKTGGGGKGKPGEPIYSEKEKMIEKLEAAAQKMARKPGPTEPGDDTTDKLSKPGARPVQPSVAESPAPPRPVRQPTVAASPTIPRPAKTEISPGVKKTESLGKQMIEGIEAEGTRSTATIPAGEIGNRLPIEIVDERWYSPDLQTLLMSKYHDPRSGETVYRLTNINRSEPDRSLFEIPSDYTLTDLAKPAPQGERPKKTRDYL